MKYQAAKHFKVWELVPPEVFKALGETAWLVMDGRIIQTIDALREAIGRPVIINTWHDGGSRTWAGFRPATCEIGAVWSQHKYGRAVDCIIPSIGAEAARKYVLDNSRLFPHITCIEDKVNWLHIDCRPIDNQGITLIQP
jgi:hypothetical protein